MNNTRNKMVHIAFLEEEKKEIKKFAKSINMTVSEFCRQAIFEKIRRLKHPEKPMASTINPAAIDKISAELKDINDYQEKILVKLSLLNDIDKRTEIIRDHQLMDYFEKYDETFIRDLFQIHKSLSLKQIMEKTNMNKEDASVYVKKLLEKGMIRMTDSGRWQLNE